MFRVPSTKLCRIKWSVLTLGPEHKRKKKKHREQNPKWELRQQQTPVGNHQGGRDLELDSNVLQLFHCEHASLTAGLIEHLAFVLLKKWVSFLPLYQKGNHVLKKERMFGHFIKDTFLPHYSQEFLDFLNCSKVRKQKCTVKETFHLTLMR